MSLNVDRAPKHPREQPKPQKAAPPKPRPQPKPVDTFERAAPAKKAAQAVSPTVDPRIRSEAGYDVTVGTHASGAAGTMAVATVTYQDERQAQGNHNVYVRILDASGKELPPDQVAKWFDVRALPGPGADEVSGNPKLKDPSGVRQGAWGTGENTGGASAAYFDLPIWGSSAMKVWLSPKQVPGNPYAPFGSQEVGPFGMPAHHHVNYLVSFQAQPAGVVQPPPAQGGDLGDLVEGVYQSELGRPSEPWGKGVWTRRAQAERAQGWTDAQIREDLVAQFRQSDEYKAKHATQPPAPPPAANLGDIVESVYQSELGRPSEPWGKGVWTQRAQAERAQGWTDAQIREDLVSQFHRSDEYKAKHPGQPSAPPPTPPAPPVTPPPSPTGTGVSGVNGAVPVRWGGAGPVGPDRVLVGYNVNAMNSAQAAFDQAAAGARFFLMMDNPGAAAALKAQYPDAIVVDRRYMPPERGLPSPQDFVRNTLGLSGPGSAAKGVIYQGLNEADILGQNLDPVAIPAWARSLEPSLAGKSTVSALELRGIWDREVAHEVLAAGGTYAAGTFSMGTPPITDADPQADAARAIFRKYYAPLYNSGQVLLDMHLYSPSLDHVKDPAGALWYERRWEYLFTKCGFDPKVRGLLSTETGIDDGHGFNGHSDSPEQVVQWVNGFKALEARPVRVDGVDHPSPFLGGALFQLAPSGDWGAYDVGRYTGALKSTYPSP